MDAAALGSSPIPGESPAGFDAKFEPEYEAVLAEINKLGSATQTEPISWAKVEDLAVSILSGKSKDILMAAYLGAALQKMHGLQGLCDAMNLFSALFTSFWETAFPPLNRLRRRTNAFEWWHERAYAEVQALDDSLPPLSDAFFHELLDALDKLDQLAGELMPDAMPLRDLREAIRRLPSQPPQSAPQPSSAEDGRSGEKTAGNEPVREPSAEEKSAPEAATAEPVEAPSAAGPAVSSESAALPEKDVKPENPVSSPASSSAESTPQPAPRQAASSASESEDARAARRAFVDASCRYAFLAHKDSAQDPQPWQILRIALWGGVAALPLAENGQTYLPAPDAVRLEALHNLLNSGKLVEAALGAEDLFASSLFCLDAQALIDEALEKLGTDFASAREVVREETLRFVRRLEGVETLSFSDGTPFASEKTRAWLQTLSQRAPSGGQAAGNGAVPSSGAAAVSDDAVLGVMAEAERLFNDNLVVEALATLDRAQGTSLAVNMVFRVEQLRLLCRAGESAVAVALARDLLEESDRRELETWDRARAVEVLTAVHDAFVLARDEEGAKAVYGRLSRLCPSAAVGLRQ